MQNNETNKTNERQGPTRSPAGAERRGSGQSEDSEAASTRRQVSQREGRALPAPVQHLPPCPGPPPTGPLPPLPPHAAPTRSSPLYPYQRRIIYDWLSQTASPEDCEPADRGTDGQREDREVESQEPETPGEALVRETLERLSRNLEISSQQRGPDDPSTPTLVNDSSPSSEPSSSSASSSSDDLSVVIRDEDGGGPDDTTPPSPRN